LPRFTLIREKEKDNIAARNAQARQGETEDVQEDGRKAFRNGFVVRE
jgi:hypothetical protein